MANLSSKTGFTPVQTQVSIPSLNTATSIQDFAAYDAQELTGFVYVDATADLRCSVKVMVIKNGAGTYEVAAVDLAGDNYASAPLVSFSMSGSTLRATLPAGIPGFVSAYIKYQLNAPALGGQYPLTVDGSNVTLVNSTTQGAFPSSPTSLDNATATALGLKQYLADVSGGARDIAYNGGIKATLSGTGISAVARATLVPYQMQDGTWRLKFNFRVTTTSTLTQFTPSINGVKFKNAASGFQSVAVQGVGSAPYTGSGTAQPNTGNFDLYASTASLNWVVSGDVELDAKPTWAY